jgi:acetate kinase
MYEIDVSGLQYLTADTYQDIHHDIAAYNRQARWVNGGTKVLDTNETAAVIAMLQTLDALVTSVGTDENASMEVREEAGTLLAGINYALTNMNNPAPTYNYAQNPNATYTEEAYFES